MRRSANENPPPPEASLRSTDYPDVLPAPLQPATPMSDDETLTPSGDTTSNNPDGLNDGVSPHLQTIWAAIYPVPTLSRTKENNALSGVLNN